MVNQYKFARIPFVFFMGLGSGRVEGVAMQLVGGVVIASDRRGKHRSRPHSIPDQVKERIREHIKLFPRRKSHYSRSSNRKREYLDEGLSISRMYRLYLEKHEPEAGTNPQAKEWLYRKIFNEEFNLSFGYPRSDTCETCDLLNVTIKATISEEDREEIQKELADHQEKASQGYQLLRDDTKASKSTENHVLLTFDLMQNLPVPTLTHGAMFYSRQLWVYNFGIHNATTSTASMYMWNEAIAGRGADEICSCLKQYLETLSPQTNRLTCYSDSCFGQNKNFQMVCFWNEQVSTRFEQIDHKFLVRGHTYLPNDRDFAHIEKCKDGARVCVPADWEEIVQKACPKKPFDVVAMETSKFVDFTEQTKQYTQRKKDTERKPVLISKAVWMNFGQGRDITGEINLKHPDEVWLRYSYSEDEPWSKVSICKGRKKLPPSHTFSLPEKYPVSVQPIRMTSSLDMARYTVEKDLHRFCRTFLGHMFFVVVDAHSKWPEVEVLKSATTEKTIEALRLLFARHGLPQQVVSDNGPQFTSSECTGFLRANRIKHILCAPYHPASNGQAKRFVQTLKRTLKTCGKDGKTLHHRLAEFLLEYRATPHATTNVAPSELFLKRKLRTRLDLMLPNLKGCVTSKQADQKQSRSLFPGTPVMVRAYIGRDKWIKGIVLRKLGPVTYQVEIAHGRILKRHVDQLKFWEKSSQAIDQPRMASTDSTIADDYQYPSADQSHETQEPTQSSEGRCPQCQRRPPDCFTFS